MRFNPFIFGILGLLPCILFAGDDWNLKNTDLKPCVTIYHAMADLGGDQFELFEGHVRSYTQTVKMVYLR